MKLADTDNTHLIKMILMGWSGTGKSTALTSLGIPDIFPGFPGYDVRVLDFDGKAAEVIINNLNARLNRTVASRLRMTPISPEQHKAALNNFDVEKLRENTKITGAGQAQHIGIIGKPLSWPKTIATLKKWEKTWDSNTIVVVDSLTYAATIAIAAYTMSMAGKVFGEKMGWQDYQEPQRLVRDFLTIMADCPAHCIICAHQDPMDIYQKTGEFVEKKDGSKEAVEEVVESIMAPVSVGSKGRVTIPAQFNHQLVVAKTAANERRIFTQPEDGVVTKTPFFATAESSYALADGLAKYWMLGNTPVVGVASPGKP